MKINGQHDTKTIDQLKDCLSHPLAVSGVLCADGHLGYSQPVGGVVSYRKSIAISGVGYDIACGNYAVRLPIRYSEIEGKRKEIADQIRKTISFGMGRANKSTVEAECLDNDPAWNIPEVAALKDLAAAQLGTVGSGNHYVDVFRDVDDWVWIGVHFGSRGLGHKITTHFLKSAGGKDGMNVPSTVLELSTDLGEQYRTSMSLGGRYAYAGREWVVDQVANIIQGSTEYLDRVHNHHNFAWEEEHFGEKVWVVRKGATPAFPGQRCFVGGSMGDMSVILRGVDSEAAKENLYSTVHGAGRIMSRTEAAGKKKWKNGKLIRVTKGKVDEDEMREKVLAKDIVLIGAGADEAPSVYRKLKEVLKYHTDTIQIETTLTPVIVAMAGANEFDPYKD